MFSTYCVCVLYLLASHRFRIHLTVRLKHQCVVPAPTEVCLLRNSARSWDNSNCQHTAKKLLVVTSQYAVAICAINRGSCEHIHQVLVFVTW